MIGRIIARPYIGTPGQFERTSNRHDYALKPFGETTMNALKDAQLDVIAVGKINDIFDGEGVTQSVRTKDNMDGVDQLLNVMKQPFTGLSFTNLVDFDAKYGHRRDPKGYAEALKAFDDRLPELMNHLEQDDLLIITADHGNDPTAPGTDHTREYVPLLIHSPSIETTQYGQIRQSKTFSDIAMTIADNFGVKQPSYGESFMNELNK